MGTRTPGNRWEQGSWHHFAGAKSHGGTISLTSGHGNGCHVIATSAQHEDVLTSVKCCRKELLQAVAMHSFKIEELYKKCLNHFGTFRQLIGY